MTVTGRSQQRGPRPVHCEVRHPTYVACRTRTRDLTSRVPTRCKAHPCGAAGDRLERAGVSRSVAMKMTGHKTEAVYRRYAIVSEADLREAAMKLAAIQGER
jgi:hypothetical protein